VIERTRTRRTDNRQVPETLDHYRILRSLGKGGMAEVYLAEDLRLHRRVALKMLRSEGVSDAEAQARLLGEARAASALNHPNIAVIYEVDELKHEGGTVRFIAMEYVSGDTLAVRSQRADLSLDEVLGWVQQAADALGEAHARGIVHRDVKPSNLMLTDSGRLKVLDFGLATRHGLDTEHDSTWTRDPARFPDGALVGTLGYMSPEQALGEDLDGRSDIFSLGAVLYQLLAGRPPFAGRNVAQVLDAVLRQDPPALEAGRWSDPRLPAVEAVARRMLAKRKDDRYASLAQVRADLEAAGRGETPVSAPARSPAVAVLSFTNLTSNVEDDWLGTGIAETVTADLRNVPGLTVVAGERVHETLKRLGGDGGDQGVAVRVGKDVGARWVLTGALQRAGEAVRVTAQLVEVDTATVAATVKIDGRMSEIFELQDRIVRELSSSLRLAPMAPNTADGLPPETPVVEAYEAFSKGVINLRFESSESLDRAVSLFERAIRLDPAYARAHLELGAAYAAKANYLGLPELSERALASLKRALELRPGLAPAWRELGGVLLSLGRDDEAMEAGRRALELAPDDDDILAFMARLMFISRAQFQEAADLFDRALRVNPQGGWFALQLAHCCALLRQFERGEAAARLAIRLQEESLSGHEGFVIVGSYVRSGHLAALQERHADAVADYERELAFLQRVDHALRNRISIELHMRLGAAHRRLGNVGRAAQELATAREAFEQRLRLGADEEFTRYYAACIYALEGEADLALGCLEKAAKQRRLFTVMRARIEPELESLKGNARFEVLIA
jgi:serine/threonine protein kinase/tetratricopeptide (TPR) repeat protein